MDLFAAPNAVEWTRFVYVLGGLGLAIGLGEWVRGRLHWSPEVTRKFVHIAVGCLIFFAPQWFLSAVLPLLLGLIFVVVNMTAIRFGLLKAMHATDRTTYGTVYYPLSFMLLVLMFWNTQSEIVSLAMLPLAIGDAGAAVVGGWFTSPTVYRLSSDRKTIEGSVAMFVLTVLALLGGMYLLEAMRAMPWSYTATAAVTVAVIATAWEGLSSRGLDNITIPLSSGLVLAYFLVPTEMRDVAQFVLGVSLGTFVAFGSVRAGFLTPGGAVATFLLAVTIFGLGGWKWTVPILAFFVLSSLLSRLGKARKGLDEGKGQTPGLRDHWQVAANGGIAGMVMIAQYLFQEVDLYPVYLGTLAAVTADTWGTELGLLSRSQPILITTWRPTTPGTNGGVTWAGWGAGLLGGCVIGLSGIPWGIDARTIVLVAVAGLAGTLLDSVLGATLQAEFRCPECGKSTDRRDHHRSGRLGEVVKGWPWMNNDSVNWFCALTGAVAVLILR